MQTSSFHMPNLIEFGDMILIIFHISSILITSQNEYVWRK